jgi:nucleoside-specific outer membrane channel protein Tsx
MNAETPGFYMEWAPRFSSSKILGQEYGGMLSDVLLSGQINVPSTSLARKIYLYGAAIDLALPSFKFFQSNFYIRDDLGKDGTTYQITLVWGMEIIDKLTFGGFLDYAGEEGDKNKAGGLSEANLLMQPQLLYEAVPSLQVGLEYQYWQNKFGVDGETESVPQIMAKWNF